MRFEKVSFEQYRKDVMELTGYVDEDGILREEWERIQLPRRATRGSAGYDFFMTHRIVFNSDIVICTGIRAILDDGYALFLMPKSGLGFRYGLRLANTIGLIDSDYAKSDNEGHIIAKLCVENTRLDEITMDDYGECLIKRRLVGERVMLENGAKFMQGVVLPYAVMEDDNADGVRNGGFGSTGI